MNEINVHFVIGIITFKTQIFDMLKSRHTSVQWIA